MTGVLTYLQRGAANPSGAGCWDRLEGFYSPRGGSSHRRTHLGQRVRPSTLAHLTSLLTSLAFGLGAFPAQAAQETFDVYHDPAPGDGWFARVVIYNPDGSSTNTYEVQTDMGPVTIRYLTTLNGPCNPIIMQPPRPMIECADQVSIVAVPDGVIPSAWEFVVHENGEATVFLSKWLGV